MAQVETVVRSQIVPLTGMNLVLPNTCIAEVINYQEPDPVKKAPEWLIGTVVWRGLSIPVVSFETANKVPAGKASKTNRIAVLNGISGDPDLSFYGVLVQGIPRLASLDETSIQAVKKADLKLPLAMAQAEMGDQGMVIPDQEKIEQMLLKAGAKSVAAN